MADLFLGPVIDKLVNFCSDYLQDKFNCQTHMKKELERLRENHLKIQAVVFAASQVHILDQNPALNKWMWQLRDAIDEADDLLDDFEYMKHEQQLSTNTEKETKVRRSQSLLLAGAQKLHRVGKDCLKKDPNLDRLEEVVQKLDRVSADVSTFHYLIESTKKEQKEQQDELHKAREIGFLPAKDFIGRGEDKECVIQWLMKPSNEEHQTHVSTNTSFNNISLLSIVGHGGMGKTTLLQHVYEEDQITKGFDLKMWVCVSNIFDVKKVIGDMLEILKKDRPSLEALPALQESLKFEVISKKFLLVLDDIWGEDEELDKSKWEKVLAPLAHGGLGSKILITTRMDSIASMIAKVINRNKEVRRLKGLQEDDCLHLLTTHAFADVENPNDHKKLRSIAGELIKKLFGCPLAAKVMGGVLNSNLDEKHWRKVLDSNLGQNDILSILKLSYLFLSKHLQSCFAFCSIFPQDYNFKRFDLVRMWIAVGFIQPSNIHEETLEDIGERYFDVLVNKSFFDKVTTYYKMHDLIHDLAQFVSKQECFRDVGDEELLLRTPETIRHLSIKLSNLKVLRKMGRFKNLRTLRITYDRKYQDYINTFNEIFKVTRSIRLLDLEAEMLFNMPTLIHERVGDLMHLRFLRCNYRVPLLPRSLSKLYHLKFIICWPPCIDYPNDCFPKDMHNVSNLRYVSHPWLNFSGIGKLVLLQELEQFHVKNEIGYRIEELKHMNDLCILGINKLENMRDATEACNAKLCDKKKLTSLSLNWCASISMRLNIINPNLDERVFDKLQPHKYLKHLHISNYMGVRSAVWMNEAHLIDNLEEIELSRCLEWQILPPFGHLPFLKILRLSNMPKVKRLDNKFAGNEKYCDFPSLKKLVISDLQALEDWFDAGLDSLFPSLTELYLRNCSNLQELPYLPPKLKTLEIDDIGWKTLNWCSISTVSFAHDKFCSLTNIERIDLRNCLECQILPPFGKLPFLKNLILQNMPKAKRLDNDKYCNFPSLEKLEISNLEALEDWFDARVDCLFPLLTQLELYNCPNLQELPYLPPKLVFLEIKNIGWKTLKCTCTTLRRVKIIDCPHLISLEEQQQVETIPNCQLMLEFVTINDPSVLQMELFRNVVSIGELIVAENDELISFSSQAEQWFLQGSSSVNVMHFRYLRSLQSLPSSLTRFSSLGGLQVQDLPKLRELPDLPASITFLELYNLESLQCLSSSLSTISPLKHLLLDNILLLKSLPDLPTSLELLRLSDLESLQCLPSSLSTISSFKQLYLRGIPLLKSLPDLPASVEKIELYDLESLHCLPSSLSNISSLNHLDLINIPLLKSLPELPPSLCTLYLYSLDNLECLPSCLSSLSSLIELDIDDVPLLRELPNPPSSDRPTVRRKRSGEEVGGGWIGFQSGGDDQRSSE